MSLKHGLLGLLGYGAMSGSELIQVFGDSLGHFWSAVPSQIYRDLADMEGRGWLESSSVQQRAKPPARVYSLTASGRDEFGRWLDDFDFGKALGVRNAFLMRIFFGAAAEPGKTLGLIRDFRSGAARALEAVKASEAETARYAQASGDARARAYWLASASYGRHYLEAAVRWADEALPMLAGEEAR